jgi:hypothetical protein
MTISLGSQPRERRPLSVPAAPSKPRLTHDQRRRAIGTPASPELDLLRALRQRSWAFDPRFAADGPFARIKGIRIWHLSGCVDVLRINGQTDAEATRCDHTNTLLWQGKGTAAHVLKKLLELPAPNDPRAPRPARASGPGLWTPR